MSLWLQVCQYGNGTCGAFEALTQRGYLITDIANTGYVSSSYTITVCKHSLCIPRCNMVMCVAERMLPC